MSGVLTDGLAAFLQTPRASAPTIVEPSVPRVVIQERAPTPVARSYAQVGPESTGIVGFFNSLRSRLSRSGELERSSNRDDAKPSSSQP